MSLSTSLRGHAADGGRGGRTKETDSSSLIHPPTRSHHYHHYHHYPYTLHSTARAKTVPACPACRIVPPGDRRLKEGEKAEETTIESPHGEADVNTGKQAPCTPAHPPTVSTVILHLPSPSLYRLLLQSDPKGGVVCQPILHLLNRESEGSPTVG